jgi:hypothetical protein
LLTALGTSEVVNYLPGGGGYVPVTDKGTSNVIPFPGCNGPARVGFEQIRLHIDALDRELQTLAQGYPWSPGEWARQTAIPIVRTECIKGYLTAANPVPSAALVGQYRWRRLTRARDEFLSALSATRISLTRMGEPGLGPEGRQEVLKELPAQRERQRRILRKLEKNWPTRTAV